MWNLGHIMIYKIHKFVKHTQYRYFHFLILVYDIILRYCKIVFINIAKTEINTKTWFQTYTDTMKKRWYRKEFRTYIYKHILSTIYNITFTYIMPISLWLILKENNMLRAKHIVVVKPYTYYWTVFIPKFCSH